ENARATKRTSSSRIPQQWLDFWPEARSPDWRIVGAGPPTRLQRPTAPRLKRLELFHFQCIGPSLAPILADPRGKPMTAALSFDQATLHSQKLVIPVRYVASGAILQTTSTAMSPEAIHVRAERPPKPGLFVGLKLYFDGGEEIARSGVVSWVTAGAHTGVRPRFNEGDATKDRVMALLARYRAANDRGCKRFHTNMAATVRKDARVARGQITNISESGAF